LNLHSEGVEAAIEQCAVEDEQIAGLERVMPHL